jgi:hypothetical protein
VSGTCVKNRGLTGRFLFFLPRSFNRKIGNDQSDHRIFPPAHSIRRFRVPKVICRAVAKEVPVKLKMRTPLVLLGIAGLTVACGHRRLNVMYTGDQTLMTVGYSADRSQSIFRANDEAQEYCRRRHQTVVFVKEDTLYQGRYREDVTAGARTAGRVAGAVGVPRAAAASRALSSPTDYKTTFEFTCK